ncbi:MAG: TraI domain-containing protein [Nitrospirae bacterium]|jgi:hypothetical protein|nr:TraI domain-containing protein [Nitrospirota bacterium]
MLERILKSKKLAPFSKTDNFSEVYSRLAEDKLKKIKDILIEDTADELADKICQRFLTHVWFLPASEGHHHAKEFGLFLHCLDTALEALKRFDDKIYFEYRENRDVIDSFETRKRRPSRQYAFFLCGLVHDLGKEAARYKVVSSNGELWDPCNEEGLYGFVQRHPDTAFSSIRYQSMDNIYGLYQKIAPFYAARLISSEDYKYVGHEDIGDILNAIGYKPADNKFYKEIIDADMQSVKKDLIASGEIKTKDVVGDFITTLREMFTEGRISINSTGAKAWVFEDRTAVSIAVLNDVRALLLSKDRKTPELNIIWRKLMERHLIEHEGWKCVYNMELVTMGRSMFIKVLRFKNSVIWDKDKTPETCKLNVSFNIISK